MSTSTGWCGLKISVFQSLDIFLVLIWGNYLSDDPGEFILPAFEQPASRDERIFKYSQICYSLMLHLFHCSPLTTPSGTNAKGISTFYDHLWSFTLGQPLPTLIPKHASGS